MELVLIVTLGAIFLLIMKCLSSRLTRDISRNSESIRVLRNAQEYQNRKLKLLIENRGNGELRDSQDIVGVLGNGFSWRGFPYADALEFRENEQGPKGDDTGANGRPSFSGGNI